jgi:uncharacterized protein YjbJ (UPF0337 family)
MSNESQKHEGVAEQIGGKIKKFIGKVTGNERVEAEGEAKALMGKAREEAAKAAERVRAKAEELKGAVKNRVGHVVDDETMAAEGKAEELRGEERSKQNRPA